MNVTRQAMIRALVSLLAVAEASKMEPSNIMPTTSKTESKPAPTEALSQYHEPPPGVDYSTNPSVFGMILRGELPAIVYDESPNVLAFRDRTPKAKFHALVVPKQFIPTVASLTQENLRILEEMRETVVPLLQQYEPRAFTDDDYVLCFHLPPFNSVDHLHLHVLAPASKMNFIWRFGKYRTGTIWCADEAHIRNRLKEGKKANVGSSNS
jgi:diadenosine tetraphosphate (Ap4A) HIT family hydrolase